MRGSVFIATSLDGFIARENGDLDWLHGSGDAPSADGEDYGYRRFMKDIDAIVMGRGTYDKVLTFAAWPYGDRPTWVASSREIAPPPPGAKLQRVQVDPSGIARQLDAAGVKHAYIDGGQTIQRFLNAVLIQRLIITRIPVLLGSGIPLFGPAHGDITLTHVSTRSWPNGFVQSEYAL